MRILLTADPELPVPPKLYGGIERIIHLLVVELKKRGHDVGLVAHRNSTSPADRLFSWIGTRSQSKWDAFQNIAVLQSAIRQFQPDLVHSFSRILYLLPVLRSPLPKIMSYQRNPSHRTTSWGAKLANGTLTFTGCSRYICQIGRSNQGVWHPIHNGVDVDQYTFQPIVSENAPLVFLSRIESIKGAHTAIAIAQQTNRRLLIAGNYSTEGEAGQYWQEKIVPHLNEQIQYVGEVNDDQKNQLLGQAAALVVPIEWEEPFGIVFIEALACGTPVISCPRGALPEIVRSGIDGFLINSVKEGCDAVEALETIDRANCRNRVEQAFSASVISRQYEQLYQNLIAQQKTKCSA